MAGGEAEGERKMRERQVTGQDEGRERLRKGDQGPQKVCSRDWPSWGQVLSGLDPT